MFGQGRKSSDQGTGGEALLPPDKQSSSASRTKSQSALLVGISLLMLAVFAACAVVVSRKKATDAADAAAESIESARLPDAGNLEFDTIEPSFTSNPQSVSLRDGRAGEASSASVLVYVSGAPAKVVSVSTSQDVPGLFLNEDCTERESITPSQGCMVELNWTPASGTSKSIFITIRYTRAVSSEYEDRTFQIPLDLAAEGGAADELPPESAPPPMPEAEAPSPSPARAPPPASAYEEEDEYEDEEEEDFDEDE